MDQISNSKQKISFIKISLYICIFQIWYEIRILANTNWSKRMVQNCIHNPFWIIWMDSYTVWLEKCPLEFQRIMNEIFNSYSKFYIVYIHDVLVFSESIKQCFKHLRTFFSITKQNRLAVSKSKISIFQTRV